jgi:hypothetical protein
LPTDLAAANPKTTWDYSRREISVASYGSEQHSLIGTPKELINLGELVIVLRGVLSLHPRKGLLPGIGPRTLAEDMLVDRSLALNACRKGRSIGFLPSL